MFLIKHQAFKKIELHAFIFLSNEKNLSFLMWEYVSCLICWASLNFIFWAFGTSTITFSQHVSFSLFSGLVHTTFVHFFFRKIFNMVYLLFDVTSFSMHLFIWFICLRTYKPLNPELHMFSWTFFPCIQETFLHVFYVVFFL